MSNHFYRSYIGLIIFSFFPLLIYAQEASLSGTVLDKMTGDPLISATIQSEKFGSSTDLYGRFQLKLPIGEHTVSVSYVGYESIIQSINLTDNQSQVIDFQLIETENILQTATVTSGRYQKPLSEVTVSLEVLKPALMENTNTTSINQIMDKIPGVNVIDGQPNIRGGSGWSYGAGSRVLVLIDDIPALQADAGLANWNDIAVENTEQIEVVKGAASALYGSSAMNGIINIRTAYAKSKPVTKFSTFYQSYRNPKDTAKIWWDDQPYQTGFSIAHRQKFNKLDVVFSAFGITEDSYRENTNKRYGRLTLGTRYRITDRMNFGFNANLNKGRSTNYFYWLDGDAGAYRANEGEQEGEPSKRLRYTIDPFFSYFDKSGNRHKILGRLYFINNDNTDDQSNYSKLFYGEYQFQRRFENLGLVVTSGLVGTTSRVEAELYGDTLFTSNNLAAYAQIEKKIGSRLNLTGGVRYEKNKLISPEIVERDTIPNGGTVTESRPIFRLGANYRIGKATYLRGSWGQGYRYPTIAEKFISTNAAGLVIKPNPSLESETGWSTEIGVKQGYRIGGFQGYFDAAAFWTEYQNMMEFNLFIVGFLPAFQSRNVGDTRIKGLEFSTGGQGKIGNVSTTILAGYTFIDPTFQDFDMESRRNSSLGQDSTTAVNILKYRFRHNVKFDIEGQYKQFSLGIGLFYTSRMEAIDNVLNEVIPGVKSFRAAHDSGNFLVNTRLAYRPIPGAKVSFIVDNLFNLEYATRPGLLEAPRSLTLRLDYGF